MVCLLTPQSPEQEAIGPPAAAGGRDSSNKANFQLCLGVPSFLHIPGEQLGEWGRERPSLQGPLPCHLPPATCHLSLIVSRPHVSVRQVAGWGWPRSQGRVQPRGLLQLGAGGGWSSQPRKSPPLSWSRKRHSRPPCTVFRAAFPSLLLISHARALTPPSRFLPTSGTILSIPTPHFSLLFPQSLPVSRFFQDHLIFLLASAPCSHGSLPLAPTHPPLLELLSTRWEVTPHISEHAGLSYFQFAPLLLKEDGRVPEASSVPADERALWPGQRPLVVRLGIAASCRLRLPAGSHPHPDILKITPVCVGCV